MTKSHWLSCLLTMTCMKSRWLGDDIKTIFFQYQKTNRYISQCESWILWRVLVALTIFAFLLRQVLSLSVPPLLASKRKCPDLIVHMESWKKSGSRWETNYFKLQPGQCDDVRCITSLRMQSFCWGAYSDEFSAVSHFSPKTSSSFPSRCRKHKRKNYYEVLGVPSVASQLEIKKARNLRDGVMYTPWRIHGTNGIFTYMKTIKINHSCRQIYRSSHGSVMGTIYSIRSIGIGKTWRLLGWQMADVCGSLCSNGKRCCLKAYRERAAEWHPDKKSHLDEASSTKTKIHRISGCLLTCKIRER